MILSSGKWNNSFLINFDGENTYFQFRTHYFWRFKRGLKCHYMACKHYYALFGSKWSYSTQKNQNGFFQWSGHCALHITPKSTYRLKMIWKWLVIDKSFKTRIIWSAHTFKGGNDISDKVIIIFDRVFQSSSKYNKVLVN